MCVCASVSVCERQRDTERDRERERERERERDRETERETERERKREGVMKKSVSQSYRREIFCIHSAGKN